MDTIGERFDAQDEAGSSPQRRPSVFISTLGCRQNQFDSDALVHEAQQRGYRLAGKAEDADVHIINTCAITHEADADSRKATRKAVRNNPQAKVVVTGCYATADAPALAEIKGVHSVIGNAEKDQLLALLEQPHSDSRSETQVHVSLEALHKKPRAERRFPVMMPATESQRTRAYLKVQEGCDYQCSFCIVPSLRGPSVSLSVDILKKQFQSLVEAGNPEINLTGVHLGTYGKDLRPKARLSELLLALLPLCRDANHPEGPTKIRLGSLDPHEVDEALIDVMAEHRAHICPYLHLPVQSGDNAILRKMRRAHTAEDLQVTVQRLRAAIPNICLGSDVIVGFPGETEMSFERTESLLQSLSIDYLHVFSYSTRSGTAAAQWPDQISKAEKKRRNHRLRSLSQKNKRAFAQSQVGTSRPVLALRDGHHGLTDNYIKVVLDRPHRGWQNAQLMASDSDSDSDSEVLMARAP